MSGMKRTETWQTVVFKKEEGGGNPCPVTLDADDLTTEEMQQMTKEFGVESAFIMKSENPECDVKARYFVPLHEMEMCIHATIGSTTVLVKSGRITTSPIHFETILGTIVIDWEKSEEEIKVSVHQFLPKFMEKNPTKEEVCKALNISLSDFGEGKIQSVATSRYKLIVPLKDRKTVDELQPDFEKLWDLCDQYDTTGFYVFAPDTEEGETVFYARQFPKRAGYPEDPATGVAASALGAYLAANQTVPTKEGWNSYTIFQGFAMGRPSIIYSEICIKNGEITETRVRGKAEIL